MTTSLLKVQIERVFFPANWRGCRYAVFQRTDGYMLCEVFFESRENPLPQMQIRSLASDLELANAVAVAINMASEWAVQELALMEAISQPSAPASPGPEL